jgi:serine/threonine protein kinase
MLLHKNIAGWNVVSELGTYPGMTGGTFSTGYVVEKSGRKAFMKAMDLQRAFLKGVKSVQALINQYVFEKEVLDFCRDRRLSGIVNLYDSGQHDSAGDGNPANIIYYLIFELADGDIRRELTASGFKDNFWKLSVLHQSANALVQLHSIDIAHQDIKPSNILSFEQNNKFKLADLGRCNSKKIVAPTDEASIPGDPSYSPPEYQYGASPVSYIDKRLGNDAYLLGSLIAFLFADGAGALIATLSYLPNDIWPGQWEGEFVDALPFLITAHTQATIALKKKFPNEIRDELAEAYFYLCHPDPALRGHPNARRQTGRPLGVDRYRSIFDRLRQKIRIHDRINRRNKDA